MDKRISLLSALAVVAAVCVPALSSAEDGSDYRDVVHDVRGNAVKDVRGNCVRTDWEGSSDECGAQPAPAVVEEQTHTHLASVYFEFNKATLTAEGRQTLDELLTTLRDKKIQAVTIAGYADAIGSSSYNLRLSEKRAHAVQHYLRIHAFHHANTTVRALGKSDAMDISKCKGLKDGKLHACMQSDRRVDIELSVVKTVVRQ
jgi:OOP family OmpA-OmpF porin